MTYSCQCCHAPSAITSTFLVIRDGADDPAFQAGAHLDMCEPCYVGTPDGWVTATDGPE